MKKIEIIKDGKWTFTFSPEVKWADVNNAARMITRKFKIFKRKQLVEKRKNAKKLTELVKTPIPVKHETKETSSV